MKSTFPPFWLLPVVILVTSCERSPQQDRPALATDPGFVYSNPEDYLPASWEVEIAPHNYTARQVRTFEKYLSKEYTKYPAHLREEMQLKVVWFSKFKYLKYDYHCTYHPQKPIIFLKSYSHAPFYTRQMLHHEFSSVLLNLKMDPAEVEKAVRGCNPKEFTYFDESGQGKNAIHEGKDSEEFNSEINRQGFLNQYAMSHWENDFNEISQNLFLPAKGFHETWQNYPRFGNKVELIIEFYQQMDSAFTKDFFKSQSSK